MRPLPPGANENSLANLDQTINLPDFADMFTVKGEHKFTDRSSLSGLFIYNQTKEPAASPLSDDKSFLDQSANWLIRHPKVFVVNNTNVLSDTTVVSFRYGYSVFPDGRNCRGGSPGVAKRRRAIGSIAKNEHLFDPRVFVFHDRSGRASRPAMQAHPSNRRTPLHLRFSVSLW